MVSYTRLLDYHILFHNSVELLYKKKPKPHFNKLVKAYKNEIL